MNKYKSKTVTIWACLLVESALVAYSGAVSGNTPEEPAAITTAVDQSNSSHDGVENSAPSIWGIPFPSVVQNSTYDFVPGADDPDGDPITFKIINKPDWASFNPLTGALVGSPTGAYIGKTDKIVISVTDGMSTTSLPPFRIGVYAFGGASVTLSWKIPSTNVDGTPLTDLAGFKIYRGTASGKYSPPTAINNPGLTSMVIENLIFDKGYYFVVTAFNTSGIESEYSSEACFAVSQDPESWVTELATSESNADVTGVTDISGDAVPDVAHLTLSGQPTVRYYSGASREKIKGVRYLGPAWSAMAMAMVADGDANGVAGDPAVAVLAHKAINSKHAVEVRRVDNGALVNKVFFLGPNWQVIDVAVIDVIDPADGLTSPALAVLAANQNMPFCKTIKVQVRWLSDGALVANRFFLNRNWTPLALEGVNRSGATPLLAVLANKAANGVNVVQARQLSDGAVQRDTVFFNGRWVARDVAILPDSNGDGKADDPAYLVLANHPRTGRNMIQVQRVSDGTRLKKITMAGAKWDGRRLVVSGDINGNLREEVGVLATKYKQGKVAIQFKDFAEHTLTTTIFP